MKILGGKTLPKTHGPSRKTWIKVLSSFLKPKEWYDFLRPGQFGLEGRWLVLFINHAYIIIYVYRIHIPGTQMTLVLLEKGLVLEG